jgi:hypothetical protein
MRVDPVHWLSRLAPGAGLVALRQTFVRRCYGGLGSSRACRKLANQNMTAARRSLANRLLSGPAPCRGLVVLRQIFVRRCHGGWGSSRPAAIRPIKA